MGKVATSRRERAKKAREKYWGDHAFRERTRARVRGGPRRVKRVKIERPLMPRMVIVRKQRILVYPSGVLRERLGISRTTLSTWASSGVLPPPTWQDTNGRRWYSKEYIECFVGCCEDRQAWALREFAAQVRQEFRARRVK